MSAYDTPHDAAADMARTVQAGINYLRKMWPSVGLPESLPPSRRWRDVMDANLCRAGQVLQALLAGNYPPADAREPTRITQDMYQCCHDPYCVGSACNRRPKYAELDGLLRTLENHLTQFHRALMAAGTAACPYDGREWKAYSAAADAVAGLISIQPHVGAHSALGV